MACRADNPVAAAVTPRFDDVGKALAVGLHHLQWHALVFRHFAAQADAFNRCVFFRVLVEAHVTAVVAAAAWQRAEQFYALQDTADEGDVAVQVARRLTDDDVQLGAVAAVRRVVASGAEDAVAVGNPGAVFFCGDREAVRKADFFRPAVRVGQRGEV